MRYVITGANRGIGLEFVRQLLERGDTVEAVTRSPERAVALGELVLRFSGRLRLHAIDVTDDESVHALGRALATQPVDVLINNAGVMEPPRAFETLDLDEVARTIAVNALGPLRTSRALLPALRLGKTRRLVHITSRMGSIADNTSGGAYGYRMSKAALNMASRSLAIDLRGEGFVSVTLHPGWVKTDMGGPSAPLGVEESVARLLGVIDRLGPEHSGRFLSHTGEDLPW